jgi:hypothetical protein
MPLIEVDGCCILGEKSNPSLRLAGAAAIATAHFVATARHSRKPHNPAGHRLEAAEEFGTSPFAAATDRE